MPKLYEYFGMVFYFYATEHLPIHVHAKFGNYGTIFELIYEDGELADVKQRSSGSGPPLPVSMPAQEHPTLDEINLSAQADSTD